MTRSEFLAGLRERLDYHERIGDSRVAGTLRLVLEEFEAVDGLPAQKPTPDRLIDLEEAAERLGVTVRWLKEHRPPYFVELSSKMFRVSERRLDAWLGSPH